jgi:hypothetical protein
MFSFHSLVGRTPPSQPPKPKLALRPEHTQLLAITPAGTMLVGQGQADPSHFPRPLMLHETSVRLLCTVRSSCHSAFRPLSVRFAAKSKRNKLELDHPLSGWRGPWNLESLFLVSRVCYAVAHMEWNEWSSWFSQAQAADFSSRLILLYRKMLQV